MSMLTTPKAPKGYELYSLPTMGGEQADVYSFLKNQFMRGSPDIYSNLLSLSKGSPEAFSQLEAPAIRQFEQQIAPGIAQRYAGSGIGASSGMQNALAGAGRELTENLQAQRLGHMEKSMDRVMQLGDRLLGTPTQQFGLAQKENWLRDIMQMLGAAGSQIGGIYGGSKLAGLF